MTQTNTELERNCATGCIWTQCNWTECRQVNLFDGSFERF